MSTSPHPSHLKPNGFFITGTDTGVGKSLVACALLRAFAARALRVVGMKPVAAGAAFVTGAWVNEDVEQLIAASSVHAPREAVNPYCFEQAIAPHIAADINKNIIKINNICGFYKQLSAIADIVIVEGAGGFCVPLNESETSADLACVLAVPVVLVVGMRLGCLNHALLTAEAIRTRGLVLAGWVANHIDAAMPYADENVAALQARLRAPMLARIAFSAVPDAATAARYFEARLDSMLSSTAA